MAKLELDIFLRIKLAFTIEMMLLEKKSKNDDSRTSFF